MSWTLSNGQSRGLRVSEGLGRPKLRLFARSEDELVRVDGARGAFYLLNPATGPYEKWAPRDELLDSIRKRNERRLAEYRKLVRERNQRAGNYHPQVFGPDCLAEDGRYFAILPTNAYQPVILAAELDRRRLSKYELVPATEARNRVAWRVAVDQQWLAYLGGETTCEVDFLNA